jgi:outer membrane protein OmpA-like peptidoglycan-associated protein
MRYITAVRWGGTFAVAATLCPVASAQESRRSWLTQPLDAPNQALELRIGSGYTQPFGNIAPGRGFPEVAGAGLGVTGDVDYRLNPHWSLGFEGQFQQLTSEQNASARGFAANFGATYHFAPTVRGDPWLRLGAGYRFFWENDVVGVPGVTTQGVSYLRHGFQVGAGQLGFDIRLSEGTAIAPVVGADLNIFAWQDGSNGFDQRLSSAQVATFIYAGLQGRFDLGGSTSASPVAVTGASVPATQPPPPAPPAPAAETNPSFGASPDVLAECKLHLDSTDKAPKFGTNQTEFRPDEIAVLKLIADCFTTGPMKGQKLLLVGRTDPRGTAAYNQELGQKRAEHVAEYLEGLGVSKSQIETESRGKQGATGHNEAIWRNERRVDILQH